ncbi:MAG: RIP metalloprotease RseP [Parcubacteria group bacterium CG2_30_45_37]|nr:MAG: RIP metalloprotease RseP [Parcubacteria group bacterium CG2_30_45_37]
MLLTIITFIIVLSVLVFAHELGHFLTARRFGVKAEEFGFGFPPRAFGVYKNPEGKWKFVWGGKEVADSPETVYSINWLPLGGFVKIKGENGENESEQDSFASRSIGQRAMMLSAGVVMNIVLAAILISAGFMMGLPQALDGSLDSGARISDRKIQVVQVVKNSPAELAGLQLGDTILSIDGNEFADFEELQAYVNARIGKVLDYRIGRGAETLAEKITPVVMAETGRGGIGIAISEIGLVRYPWQLAIWQGVKTTLILTWAIMVAFYELIKGLIFGQGVTADLSGPVGIATLTGQVARLGFIYLLQFTALLSINLAVINFFPFPALDGGRVLFLIIEKIKGSPVKKEVEGAIHNIGFALLMVLVLVVTFRDINRFSNIFNNIWDKIF